MFLNNKSKKSHLSKNSLLSIGALLFSALIFLSPDHLRADPRFEEALKVCQGEEKTGWAALYKCTDPKNKACIAWEINGKDGVNINCLKDSIN